LQAEAYCRIVHPNVPKGILGTVGNLVSPADSGIPKKSTGPEQTKTGKNLCDYLQKRLLK